MQEARPKPRKVGAKTGERRQGSLEGRLDGEWWMDGGGGIACAGAGEVPGRAEGLYPEGNEMLLEGFKLPSVFY